MAAHLRADPAHSSILVDDLDASHVLRRVEGHSSTHLLALIDAEQAERVRHASSLSFGFFLEPGEDEGRNSEYGSHVYNHG